MVQFLAKRWIKNSEDYQSTSVRQAYGMLCGLIGIFLNLLLFTGKFIAGTLSCSIAITADAFNNLSDAGSSFIMLIGFKMAGQKPDPDHPFGHGRIEYVSGLLVSLVILMMAVELIRDSFAKILHPQAVSFSPVVVIILVVSIVVKLYMFLYNRSIGKKLNSATMVATAMDSISDTCATFVVLVTTLIAHFTGLQIDGYCGILVGLFIFYAGFSAAKDTIDPLLGQAAEPELVQGIETIVMSYSEIHGIHDMVIHNYGPGRVFVSLHAEVSAEGNIMDLHDVIDTAEAEVSRKMDCEVVIHMDPICMQDEETNQWKNRMHTYFYKIDKELSMHDFRMVKGPTHTNLIFDVVVPYDHEKQDGDVVERLTKLVQEDYPNVYLVVKVDRSYIKKEHSK